jgi:hypothetical protein
MADISINPVTRRTQYTNNTGLGPFAFNFNILQNTDIVVYKNSTLLTLTTDYTVTINANGTGSVTLTGSGNGTALVLADLLTIVGGRELSRTTDFVTAGDLLASSLNEQLDSNVIMVQQLDERFDRAMKLNIADEDGDLTLPLKSSRAGKTLAFDSSGNPVVGEDIGNWRGNWVAGTTYTVRDLVKDTSNNNVYRVNTAHTSSGSTPLSSNANSSYYDLVVDAESATTSATNAANSATAAASSASAASTSASNAATSATNASNSASAASTSASNAATSATNASNSATSAATQASNAATSASNAATSESNASTSETNAASSASSASTSATSASTSASSAATSATNAGTSAGNASTSETNAANSASAAATSASNASTSETNAATSATNSANSATASANSATSAAASAASAAASYDYFDDRYLGTKASDPTLDNDGDALVAGALYFNSTANEMRVYDGANWIPASSAGSVSFLTYNYTATSGQTTFSGADDNAASLSYSVGNLMVTVNGVVLEDGTDYTATSGTSVVLTTGAVLNDEVNIYAFKSFTTADMVPASTGGTFTGNVTFSNAATVNGAFTSVGIDDNATSTAITIDSSENVGIGTSSPTSLLHLGGASNKGVQITSSTSNAGFLGVYQDQCIFGVNRDPSDGSFTDTGKTAQFIVLQSQNGNGFIKFATTGTNNIEPPERMRIDASGNVGIGTSSPLARLDVESGTGNVGFNYGTLSSPERGNLWYDTDGSGWKFNIGKVQSGSFTSQVTIQDNGNVGIGTSSVTSGVKLQVQSTGGTILSIKDITSGSGDYSNIWFGDEGSDFAGFLGYNHSTDAMTFGTSTTERMRITSGGYTKMSPNGTYVSAGGSYHEMYQNSNTITTYFYNGSTTGSGVLINVNNEGTAYPFLSGYSDSAARYNVYIYSNGNIENRNNSYGGISDQKLKQDIENASSQWEDVKGIQLRKFRWKQDVASNADAPYQLGVIAQELEASGMSGLIEETPDKEFYDEVALDENGNPVVDENGNNITERKERLTGESTKSVKYSILTLKAIKALQEAMERIETLEARIATLEGN